MTDLHCTTCPATFTGGWRHVNAARHRKGTGHVTMAMSPVMRHALANALQAELLRRKYAAFAERMWAAGLERFGFQTQENPEPAAGDRQ